MRLNNISFVTLAVVLFASQAVKADSMPALITTSTSSTTSSSSTSTSTTKTTSSTSSTKSSSSSSSASSSTTSFTSGSSTITSSSSSSTSASSTTSYTYTATIPASDSPYNIKYHDLNGTVFIAVGSIVFSILFLFSLLRLWFHYKSRRDAYKTDKINDFYNSPNDYYGGDFGSDSKDGYFMEKSGDYESTLLPYDSRIFSSKTKLDNHSEILGDADDNLTIYKLKTNNSFGMLANPGGDSNNKMDYAVSQPGHQLRTALNMNSTASLPIRNQNNRYSFISPINDLISQTAHQQIFQQPHMNIDSAHSIMDSSPNMTIDDDSKSFYMSDSRNNSTGNLISSTNNLTLGLGLLGNGSGAVNTNNVHQRTPSNYEEFYGMIEKSLVNNNSTTNTAAASHDIVASTEVDNNNNDSSATVNVTTTRKHKRPPSMQLEDLLKSANYI